MSDVYGAQAPLVPGQSATNVVPPVPDQQQTMGLADQWRNWMASPQNRASMIQFGLALSQPTPAGQNWMGQIGQAAGQGGEAADRVTALQMKGEEQGSKEELRATQANLAGERALHAGDITAARTDTADARRAIASLQGNIRLRGMYDSYSKAIDDQNRKRNLLGDPALPKLGFEDWAAQSPALKAAMGSGASLGGEIPPGGAAGAANTNLYDQARDAISKGADPAAVKKRLRDQGVDPAGL